MTSSETCIKETEGDCVKREELLHVPFAVAAQLYSPPTLTPVKVVCPDPPLRLI